jgi:hypothetical protein
LNIVDRFTRDRVSEIFWGTITIIMLVLVGLTFLGEQRAVDRDRTLATTRAEAAVDEVVRPAMKLGARTDPLADPLDQPTAASLEVHARVQILDDPRALAVRVWSKDGRLLFSTDPADHIGSAGAINDAQIAGAASGASATDLSRQTLLGDPLTSPILRTYAPIRSDSYDIVGVAEIDQSDATVLSGVHRQWLAYRLGFIVLSAIAIGLLILSLREPVARIGAGVPFHPDTLPEGVAVMDEDQAEALEEAGSVAKRRVALMEERLLETEEARKRLEGELQRALTQIATRPRSAPVAPAPAPARQRTRRGAVTPDLVVVPEPAPEVEVPPRVEPAPSDEPAAEAVVSPELEPPAEVEPPPAIPVATVRSKPSEPASPTRRARRRKKERIAAVEPPPVPELEPEPARPVEEPEPIVEPEPVAAVEASTPEPEPGPEPVRPLEPEPEPEPEPIEPEPFMAIAPPPEPEPDVESTRAAMDDAVAEALGLRSRRNGLVVVPEVGREEVTAKTVVLPEAVEEPAAPAESSDERDEETALDVLERLVEPVRSPAAAAPHVDLGDMRRRLARTAARKKPGGTLDKEHATDPFEPGPPRR